MNKENIIKAFNKFKSDRNLERRKRVWKEQKEEFRNFWEDKILNDNHSELSEFEMDKVIRFFDSRARGAREFSENGGLHAALAHIRQGQWYRALKSIKNNDDIKELLDKTLNSKDDDKREELVTKLKKINDEYANGLTGKKAVILNAIIFTYSPEQFISMLSLSHRYKLLEFFEFGKKEDYGTYGQQVIQTNRDIINGFKENYGIEIVPHLLTSFIYDHLQELTNWMNKDTEEEISEDEPVEEYFSEGAGGFALEKHLEDFLVANWESTELGEKYNLIEEEGEIVSQQYSTKEIGDIDLLVTDKETDEYVVIELKKGQTSDRTVGQLSRYMGWVRENKANGNDVQGIIIAGSQDMRLEYALQEMPNIELFLYSIDFKLKEYE